MLRQVMLFILGDANDFDLEYRFFHFYCLLGLIVSILAVLSMICLDFPRIAKISMLVFSVFVSLCWYLSRCRGFSRLSIFITSLVLIFILTPGLWILNSGSYGGAQYFFVFWGVLICSIYRGWQRHVWLMLLFIVIGVLMYIEYTYPFFIIPYASRDARYFDIYTSMLAAMLSTTITFIIYSKSYHAEHEHVIEYAQQMEKAAVTDGLSGLYNQTYLNSCLENEIIKAEYLKSSLSLIMIDSDHFKSLNDTYGHPTGNQVLIQFADILRSSIRGSDIAGRCGGDEFLLICPRTSLEEAVSVAERLRNIVQTAQFGEYGQIKITISCGIAAWHGESQSKFLEEVDQALYAAKRSGRNRVEVYRDNINS